MFSIFLFVVVFSFFNWLRYEPQCASCQQFKVGAVVVPELEPVNELITTMPSAPTKATAETTVELTTPPVAEVDPPIPAPFVPEPPDLVLPTQDESSLEATLKDILAGVDIDNLQLRPGRKVASALGIAQKVNGRDQPLDWLKGQIKAKLQQPKELPPEAILAVRELLAS